MRFLQTAALSVLTVLLACGNADIGSTPDPAADLPDRSPGGNSGPAPSASNDPNGPSVAAAFSITITLDGAGTITSVPSGITCSGTTCTGSFEPGTSVALSQTASSGSIFSGWGGSCSGAAACTALVNADVAIDAHFLALTGTWTGTYTNVRPANGCTFHNAGNLTAKFDQTGATSSGSVDGLELRESGDCAVVGSTKGSSPSAPVATATDGLTGDWNMNVDIGGKLDFPFKLAADGKKLTGTWTCSGCTGGFTLTQP